MPVPLDIAPGAVADMGVLWRMLTFQAGRSASMVVAGTSLLGVAAGLVGTLALLRRRALMSDAISHATLPGIGVAFLIATALGLAGRSSPVLMLGGGVTAVLAVLTVHLLGRHGRLGEDAAIAAVLSVFFGAGVVVMSIVQSSSSGEQGGLRGFIFGQATGMTAADVRLMAMLAAGAGAAVWLLFKEFSLVCFDPEFARASGWPVGLLDLAMMALVVVVTLAGIQAVGLVLVVAMLIVPAAAARFWSERASVVAVLAGLLGGLSGALGSALSAMFDRLPTGGVIVLAAGGVFLASLIAAPRRGVVATMLRRAGVRMSIMLDHRTAQRVGGPSPASSWIDRLLLMRRLAVRSGGRVELTRAGRARGERVLRARRRWEEFVAREAGLDPSHAAASADLVEHVLAPEAPEAAGGRRMSGGSGSTTGERAPTAEGGGP